MGHLTRRTFLGGAAAGLAAGATALLRRGEARACGRAEPAQPLALDALASPGEQREMATRFHRWLRTAGVAKERDVQNLVWNFYETDRQRGAWVYPMLSGKAILWLVRRGAVGEAAAIAKTLLFWQQTSRTGALAKSYGAFPSLVEPRGGAWVSGDRFYAGDNLVILEALVLLHERTKDPDLLNAAVGVGTWLTEIMSDGRRQGVWAEDHGAPMHFVTAAGDFSNHIHGSVEMLWIGALHRLGKAAAEPAYCRQADRAFRFYLAGQYASGAILDHYDPGYPAVPYDPGRWRPYQAGQVISDNVLRSALGLCRMGELERARRFFRWLKTERGGVPAYLDLATGGEGFPPGQRVYFDVTSSGLHRSLCQWLGEKAAAEEAVAFLRRVRDRSGAWVWGVYRDDLAPVEPKLAPVAGFWATADLSTRVV